MSDVAVSVRGIGKRYRIAHDREPYARLTESLWNTIRHPLRRGSVAEEFWALRDVTFDVTRGDVIGIIGRNGAGKSTLLKILSRITDPTEGEALLHGRVSSLLEVGTGFHPELTGRENIFLSGSILGMRRSDIRRRFDEIVAFAEVERFLDTPVKRYSSGMQVRLGFAVAAHLEPDILVVDEVLAVGDAAFQKKCLAKMEDVAHGGRTVLFVSHNMAAVESMCSRGVVLDGGTKVFEGPSGDAIAAYLTAVGKVSETLLGDRRDRSGDGRLRFTRISAAVRTGDDSTIHLRYIASERLSKLDVSVGVFDHRRDPVLYLANRLTQESIDVPPGEGTIVCRLPNAALLPGRYVVNVHCLVNGQLADWVADAATLDVADGDFYGSGKLPPPNYGHLAVLQSWTVESV